MFREDRLRDKLSTSYRLSHVPKRSSRFLTLCRPWTLVRFVPLADAPAFLLGLSSPDSLSSVRVDENYSHSKSAGARNATGHQTVHRIALVQSLSSPVVAPIRPSSCRSGHPA